VIAQSAGTGFKGYQSKAGDELLLVRPGTLSAAEMFNDAQHDNTVLTWVIRAIGIVAMFIGFTMVFAPLVVLADVVPFIGDVLGAGAAFVAAVLTAIVAPVVIAIALIGRWFRSRWWRSVWLRPTASRSLRRAATRRRRFRPSPRRAEPCGGDVYFRFGRSSPSVS